ncbi:MAG: hypothetical protein IJ190_05915 [Prevotella sp.]|nr:hypothetical protein [Prevotella sp.]
MTLKELSEHPERVSEEERKAFEETFNIIREFKEQSKYILNGITPKSGRSQEELAKSYYEETMLMAAVLESFVYSPEQEYQDINKFVFNYTDNAFIFDVSVARYNLYLAKLAILGLIEVTKEDKYNSTFAITEEGLVVIRQQNYSNLAQAALFNLQTQRLNDQTLELSKRAVKQNWLMLIVAIASAVAAILSVFIAMRG